jgi:hypothetical protein
MKSKGYVILFGLFSLLAFPLFYFVYKYGNPEFGTNDFFSYYKLYENWNIKEVDAPFNMRLLSSFFVYVMVKTGLFYDTATAFDQFGLDKHVFFNAVFFNYLCVVATCLVIFKTSISFYKSYLMGFVAGLIYLLGFGTLFYELMPITDALSVLLFSLILSGYLKRQYWIIVPLLFLILQREYIFLALSLMALLDLYKYRVKYYAHILGMCILCFGIYFVLRKTIFYTPRYDHQASFSYFMESVFTIKFPLLTYLRQTALTLNIFFIYVLLFVYKESKRMTTNRFEFMKIILLFLQINIISFAAVFGNNTGRYFYMLVPLVIFQIIAEVQPFIRNLEVRNEKD